MGGYTGRAQSFLQIELDRPKEEKEMNPQEEGPRNVWWLATLGGGAFGAVIGAIAGLTSEPSWLFTRGDLVQMYGIGGAVLGLVAGAILGLVLKLSR